MKLRKVQGKLKIEHSIIDGVRDLLEDLLRYESRDPLGDPRCDPAGARREGRCESARHGTDR